MDDIAYYDPYRGRYIPYPLHDLSDNANLRDFEGRHMLIERKELDTAPTVSGPKEYARVDVMVLRENDLPEMYHDIVVFYGRVVDALREKRLIRGQLLRNERGAWYIHTEERQN